MNDDHDVDEIPIKTEKRPKRLVQALVDAETVEFLIKNDVDMPELIRKACAKAAERMRMEKENA